MAYSERLKFIRKGKGLTQKQVAAGAHITEQSYQRFEYGSVRPGLDVLVALADFFDVGIDYLIGRSNNDTPFSIHDQWEQIFKGRIADLLATFDPTDSDAAHVNVGRLEHILEQDEPLTFQEALDISEEIGVPLDYMLGISNELKL